MKIIGTYEKIAESIMTELFKLDKTKIYDLEIKLHREKRSINANAYFHLLVNRISDKLSASDEEIKRKLVLDYGTIDTSSDGKIIGFKLLSSIPVERVSKYGKVIGKTIENGKEFNQIVVYKETHTLDTKEMSKLIDGTVSEAKELGIETLTPEELERMKGLWNENK